MLANPEELAGKVAGSSSSSRMTEGKYITGILFGGILLLSCEAFSQSYGQNAVRSDTLSSKPGKSLHSLYAGTGYGSNMVYLGSTISQENPYLYGSLTYGFKNELYASFSAVHLSHLDPFLAFYIGSVNYNHVFNSWFDISAGINRYQVDRSLTDTLFNSFTYADLALGFDWKLLYTKISAGGLFSEYNQAFFQLRNSRYFQTSEFFRGKANISFDPYVNLLFGTYTEVGTTTETTNYYSVSSPYRKWRKNGKNPVTNTVYTYSDRFGLLEMDFGLPVSFNTDLMTIEAEPSYIIPFYEEDYNLSTKGFIFNLSIIFRIF